MSILIKDNETGRIHEYGTNCHDSLHISSDGSCLYYENLQNGDGSMCGGYSFVMEDGKIPSESETADAIHGMCYFNIGGLRTEPKEREQLAYCLEELKLYKKALELACKGIDDETAYNCYCVSYDVPCRKGNTDEAWDHNKCAECCMEHFLTQAESEASE